MSEFKFEKKLGIKTSGLQDWAENIYHYNRCEPTPYKSLDVLFKHYSPKKTDRLVDFGSGKGRIAFYVHNRFGIPVVGVEGQDDILAEALANKASYEEKLKSAAPIEFRSGLAEDFAVGPLDTVFFFFNPFSADVFYLVLKNILLSLVLVPRPADLILYYPFPRYEKIMEHAPGFSLIEEIPIPKTEDPRDKFLLYRYDPEQGLNIDSLD